MARQRRTSNDLAEILHVSQSSASRRMTGEVGMNLDEVELVTQWLGIEAVSLLRSVA